MGHSECSPITGPADSPGLFCVLEQRDAYSELCALCALLPLFVRKFGVDAALTGRLVKHLRSWDAAVCPSIDGMRVCAYHKQQIVCLSTGMD